MTTTVTSATLSTAQRRVALHLVRGLRVNDIADRLHLKPDTVTAHIRAMRALLGFPPRVPRHILVHALLAAGQMLPPAASGTAPQLANDDLELLRSLARHNGYAEAANAVGLTRRALERRIRALRAVARARDDTDLIIWAHSFGLLGTRSVFEAPSLCRTLGPGLRHPGPQGPGPGPLDQAATAAAAAGESAC